MIFQFLLGFDAKPKTQLKQIVDAMSVDGLVSRAAGPNGVAQLYER